MKKRCKTRELDGELKEVRTTLSPLYHPFAYDNIPLFYGTWNSSLLTQCYIDLIPYVLLWRSTTYKFNYQADAKKKLLFFFTLTLSTHTYIHRTRLTFHTHLQMFKSGRLLAAISSRPGQSGRADGYILEGPELAFYRKKLRK